MRRFYIIGFLVLLAFDTLAQITPYPCRHHGNGWGVSLASPGFMGLSLAI